MNKLIVKQNMFHLAFWVHKCIILLDNVFLNIYITTYFFEFVYFYLNIKFVKLFIYPRIRERLLERFTDNFVIGLCSAAIYQVYTVQKYLYIELQLITTILTQWSKPIIMGIRILSQYWLSCKWELLLYYRLSSEFTNFKFSQYFIWFNRE